MSYAVAWDRLGAQPAWAAYHRPAGPRWVGWGVVLLLHGALVAAWLLERPAAPVTVPPRVVTMRLLPLPPPEPPAPPPPEPAPLRPKVPERVQPAPRPPRAAPGKPRPVERPAPPVPAPAPRPALPMHQHVQSDEWVQPEVPSDAAPVARRAPPGYAEAVKAGIVAKVVYPANARYPTPRGFKGDPRELMRQCTIPYEVVIDRAGHIVSMDIDRCGDDLLDAAAEAAILKAQPFPPPPDDAEQHRVYGSINFLKPRLDRPAVRP